jgi:hypothetical protein
MSENIDTNYTSPRVSAGVSVSYQKLREMGKHLTCIVDGKHEYPLPEDFDGSGSFAAHLRRTIERHRQNQTTAMKHAVASEETNGKRNISLEEEIILNYIFDNPGKTRAQIAHGLRGNGIEIAKTLRLLKAKKLIREEGVGCHLTRAGSMMVDKEP